MILNQKLKKKSYIIPSEGHHDPMKLRPMYGQFKPCLHWDKTDLIEMDFNKNLCHIETNQLTCIANQWVVCNAMSPY